MKTKILDYPNFVPISIEHKEFILDKNSIFEPYSDYNLLSLLSWNVNESNCLANLDGNLVVKLEDYLGDSFLYLFMGKNKIENNMSLIIDDFGKLDCIPEACLPMGSEFDITPDRDNFDYIIDLEEFVSLKGGAYRTLRKKIGSFEKEFPNNEIKVFDTSDKNRAKEVLTLTKEWCENHGFDMEKTDEDLLMTKKFLEFSPHFECFMLGVYIKDKLVAFTFNEVLPGGWGMGHFGKSINSYDDSSIYAEYCTARHLVDRNIRYLNHEQDTGITGLREYKESLRPKRYLKKYTVRANP